MNRKAIIEIVISILAFAGAGVILYNGLHSAPPAPASPTAAQTPAVVLPYGTALDFSILHKQNLQFHTYNYPVLSTSTDVGVDPVDLVKPQAPAPGQ